MPTTPNTHLINFDVVAETWPIEGHFTIARGSKTTAEVVVVSISANGFTGRGECVPYPRNGETVASVIAAIESIRPQIVEGLTRRDLQNAMPPGAARNAVDCALVDLEAKQNGVRAHTLFGLPTPEPVTTAYTISLGSPDEMASAARAAQDKPLLKLKLGGAGDAERLEAVRAATPNAELIVDANESWTSEMLSGLVAACLQAGVRLIEQPMPADADEELRGFLSPVPLCADESCHSRASLDGLVGKYQFVNIKLDKTGGITEAVALAEAARAKNFGLMLGCMVGTSLAMAPIAMLAPAATFIDLDGPLLLSRDRPEGLHFEGATLHPAEPSLWG